MDSPKRSTLLSWGRGIALASSAYVLAYALQLRAVEVLVSLRPGPEHGCHTFLHLSKYEPIDRFLYWAYWPFNRALEVRPKVHFDRLTLEDEVASGQLVSLAIIRNIPSPPSMVLSAILLVSLVPWVRLIIDAGRSARQCRKRRKTRGFPVVA
jgi:hypothetical protein